MKPIAPKRDFGLNDIGFGGSENGRQRHNVNRRGGRGREILPVYYGRRSKCNKSENEWRVNYWDLLGLSPQLGGEARSCRVATHDESKCGVIFCVKI
jgi:hypothetical protein